MIQIEFLNSKNSPIYIQVDPWACLYKLDKGQSIEIIAESTSKKMRFSIYEGEGDTRILTLLDCDEFFIMVGGKRIHWEEYQSNES